MWSQYDENLSNNPFFKEIQENHLDIIEESSIQRWIICVPRIGTFEPSEISSDVILDHIIVCPTKDPEKECYTLSKKPISIVDKIIITDVSNPTNNVNVLFVETFYNRDSSKFIVWCIDHPLFLKRNFCDSHIPKQLNTLHDCIDFLWCNSLSHSILDSIKNVVCNFNCNNELEIESLQAQKELIGILFSQCLQVCFKNEALREKCLETSQFVENLKLAVETYMQYCLGKSLIFSLNTLNHQKDSYLNKTIRNCSDVQYQDLGIANDFSDTILAAKREFNQINSYYTVLEKTNCLKKTLDIIFEAGNSISGLCVTSDDVLQLLVFLILKLNVNNWFANLVFIKEFQLSSESSDQRLFCISSFEAALEFISSSRFWDIKNNVKNIEYDEIAVNFLESQIKLGDINSVRLIPGSDNYVKSMCHPLCVCSKCRLVVQQQNNFLNSLVPFTEISDSLLVLATRLEKCEVVEFLLNRGVDVYYTDSFGKTCFHYAAAKGLQNILLLLIRKTNDNREFNVNIVDQEKNTPLHLACLHGHENCVKALIYSSPDIEVNIGNSFGDTPLILAARWGYLDIVKVLLENGASVCVKNKRNQNVLDVACNFYIIKVCEKYSRQKSKVAKSLLDFNSVSSSVLEDSCKNHGVRPRSTDQFRKVDLLIKSIENNDFPLTSFYLGYNSSQAIKTEQTNCHPLCICDKCKNEPYDDLNHKETTITSINVNMCNASGQTPLHTAAKFGRTEILRLLLDNGALPNVKTFETLYTPLHLACIYERVQTIRELLKCGECNVDEQDAKGNTPLYYSCQAGNVKITEILLTSGADCNKKNYDDKSALSISEENRHHGVFKLLKNNLRNSLERDSTEYSNVII
uniref:Ankyrin repeat domain-containing protein 27-like n=1 Tax=Diabrotica virgifera virgifera TaxID=50390 RepID=A0A6P7GU20_DIAVI